MMRLPSHGRARLLVLVLAFRASAFTLSEPGRAEDPEVAIDDANPMAALGTEQDRAANPLRTGAVLMEILERADAALTAGDGARAARYFEAVVSAVPEQALGHRKLCEARSLAEDFDGALRACRGALERPGATVEDHLRHLALLVIRPTQPSSEDIEAADRSLAHIEEQQAITPDVLDLSCQLAQRLSDQARLAACVQRLEAIAPRDSRTAAYGWALALRTHDEAAAQAAFERARALQHDPQKLDKMRARMKQEFPSRGPWYWAAGLLMLMGMGLLWSLRPRGKAQSTPGRALERAS